MIVELLNGTQYNLSDYNCAVEDYNIPSLMTSHETVVVNGASAPVITNTTYMGRTIPVQFVCKAHDIQDFYLLRDEIYAIFTRKEAFFIVFKDEPYKRWLVKVEGQFSIEEEVDIIGNFEINFICVNPYAQSIGTSMNLENHKEWDVNLWSWNGAIDWDEDLQYTFTTNDFTVKNLGNVVIDPCEHELEIVVKATASSYLQIRNNTTGETYRYNASLSSTDTLIIKGVSTFKNGASAFRNTNYKLLTLAVGNNSFTVTGGTIQSIAFNFRFLYK